MLLLLLLHKNLFVKFVIRPGYSDSAEAAFHRVDALAPK